MDLNDFAPLANAAELDATPLGPLVKGIPPAAGALGTCGVQMQGRREKNTAIVNIAKTHFAMHEKQSKNSGRVFSDTLSMRFRTCIQENAKTPVSTSLLFCSYSFSASNICPPSVSQRGRTGLSRLAISAAARSTTASRGMPCNACAMQH